MKRRSILRSDIKGFKPSLEKEYIVCVGSDRIYCVKYLLEDIKGFKPSLEKEYIVLDPAEYIIV